MKYLAHARGVCVYVHAYTRTHTHIPHFCSMRGVIFTETNILAIKAVIIEHCL